MKPWWKSKTIWFNVLMAVSAVLTEVESWLADSVFNTPEWATELIILFAAVVNIVLRMITHQGIRKPRVPPSAGDLRA